MAGNKYLYNNAGSITEAVSNQTSAGAGDAGKLVALNSSGVLDSTVVNSTTSSAGATDNGKVVALDNTGRIDESMMPVGIGADTATVTASEAIGDGDLVNIYNSSGTAKCRKADAANGYPANGYVLASVLQDAAATVYFEGTNDHMSGLTPGLQYLSNTTPGDSMTTAPSTSGHIVQVVGFAVSATAMNFQSRTPITLA